MQRIRPSACFALAVVAALVLPTALASAAERSGYLRGHEFRFSGEASGVYEFHARVRERHPSDGAVRDGEIHVRVEHELRFRPGDRYGETRLFARGLPRRLLPYISESYREHPQTFTEVQTVSGSVADIDDDGHHGRAHFDCPAGAPLGGEDAPAIFGLERRRGGGWQAFVQVVRTLGVGGMRDEEILRECTLTSDRPGRADVDGWREGIAALVKDLLESPLDVGLPADATPRNEGATSNWTRVSVDSAAHPRLPDAALRRRRFSVPLEGRLPASYSDCAGTLDNQRFEDVLECRQSFEWQGRLDGRRVCRPGRFWFGYSTRRGRPLPGAWYCLAPGRRLP